MKTVTSSEMRLIDRRAMEEYAIPGIALMENAGKTLAAETISLLPRGTNAARIAVFCGPGNNGGDGLVAARFLAAAGHQPDIILIKPPSQSAPDACRNYAIVAKCAIPIIDFTPSLQLQGYAAVIDALLGTGIKGEVAGAYRDAIRLINAAGVPVASADIPSGLDADTGAPAGDAVHATLTVTMGLIKQGLLAPAAQRFTGRLVVADIGLPRQLIV